MTPHRGAGKHDTSWCGWSAARRGKLRARGGPPRRPGPRPHRRDVQPVCRAGPDDVPGAAAIRLANLRAYLGERAGADVVALGEAAGYQGMRWSGIAFTSERDLARWGDPYRPTCAARRWSEPSGTIVHRVLGELGAERRVILWNTVPTHPHRPGEPLSNRRPAVAEVEAGRRVRTAADRARAARDGGGGRAGSPSRCSATGRRMCATPQTAAARRSPRGCARSSGQVSAKKRAWPRMTGPGPFTARGCGEQRPLERVGERRVPRRHVVLEPRQAGGVLRRRPAGAASRCSGRGRARARRRGSARIGWLMRSTPASREAGRRDLAARAPPARGNRARSMRCDRREVRVQEEALEVLGGEGRDREPPAAREHAGDLAERRRAIGQRVHDEVHVGRVEPAVLERQPLGDALLPADAARVGPGARPAQHLGRRVDAPHLAAEPLVGEHGEAAGAAADVEQPAAAAACRRACARPARAHASPAGRRRS